MALVRSCRLSGRIYFFSWMKLVTYIFVTWELFHFSAFPWSIGDERVDGGEAWDGFLPAFCAGADPPFPDRRCLGAVFSFHIYGQTNSNS